MQIIKQLFDTSFFILFYIIGIISSLNFIQGKDTIISNTEFKYILLLSVILAIIKEIYIFLKGRT